MNSPPALYLALIRLDFTSTTTFTDKVNVEITYTYLSLLVVGPESTT